MGDFLKFVFGGEGDTFWQDFSLLFLLKCISFTINIPILTFAESFDQLMPKCLKRNMSTSQFEQKRHISKQNNENLQTKSSL